MDVLHTVRTTITLGFMALPLLLVGFLGFTAVGLGNMGLFMLFIGHTILIPLVVSGIHFGLNKKATPGDANLFIRASDRAQLVPSAPHEAAYLPVAPSWWMAHVMFFLGYILTNAAFLYSRESERGTSKWLQENRKSRTAALMVISSIAIVALPLLRYFFTGLETPVGILVAVLLCGGLGAGWFFVAEACGARHSDVFGMASQMIPKAAREGPPMTCVYTAKP
jgi:hypothetical protein